MYLVLLAFTVNLLALNLQGWLHLRLMLSHLLMMTRFWNGCVHYLYHLYACILEIRVDQDG